MASVSTPRMRAVIFAGGVGTRMWPVSRKKSPKQFEPIIEGKSTLQLAIERLRPDFSWADIFISTGQVYVDIVKQQLPQIPVENIIGEPEMRDVAPAVGYLMAYLSQTGPDIPTAILWSDHLVERVDVFKQALFCGAEWLAKDPDKFIFIGQKPRFPNQNLGWIEFGDDIGHVNGFEVKKFVSWHYRPSMDKAKEYFESGHYAWNPGYFVITPRFVLNQFEQHAPEMYGQIMKIKAAFGTDSQMTVLKEIYPTMEKISFDDAVVTKTEPEKAVVLSVDLGWADIGTWEALKEALQQQPIDNFLQGEKIQALDCQNSIIYSSTEQLVATIGLKDLAVVVTPDAILVTPQCRIPDIKKMLAKFEGTPLERYT